MRDVINKGLTEEVILHGAEEAFKGGWNKVKLYFMMGLPTETEEDMKGIAHLCEKVAMHYYNWILSTEMAGISGSQLLFPLCQSHLRRSSGRPCARKKNTPDGRIWSTTNSRRSINRRSLSFKYHDAKTTVLEGILARATAALPT